MLQHRGEISPSRPLSYSRSLELQIGSEIGTSLT
jgi:hypothetical protein